MLPSPEPSRNRLLVDLEAIAHNLARLRALTPPGSRVAGVVKADAYGHGLLPAARLLVREGVEFLAVGALEEAARLRGDGPRPPILVLLGVWPDQARQAAKLELTPVVSDLEVCRALAAAGRELGRRATCQLKVDTGMGRLGVSPDECLELLERAAGLEGLEVTGLVSHLATAGEPGDAHCRRQAETFAGLLAACRERGFALPDSSLAGSGGVLVPPPALEGRPALARLGVALYGGLPSPGAAGRADLRGAMSFHSRLLAVRRVSAGTAVSYGLTWRAETDAWLGVIPVGYANGYPRSLSNRGRVLIGGTPAPIRGRVCMNLTVVELDGRRPRPQPGDEATLLGRQGDEEIAVGDLARRAGTISYEITCSLGAANPRVYSPS